MGILTLTDPEKSLFLEHAIEHISVGIHAIDLLGNTVIYNQKMQEMKGLDLREYSNLSFLELLQYKEHFRSLLHVIETEKPILNYKQTYWNKHGHEITSLNDTIPLYDNEKLIGAIEFARDITSLEKLIYQPLRRYGEPLTFDIITAVSNEMKQVIELAKKAAYTETPVLLIGESGTGKDMIAEGIHHYLSPKKNEFITIFSRREDALMLSKVEAALNEKTPCTFFFERIEYLDLNLQLALLHLLEQTTTNHHMVIASSGSDPIELIANGTLLKELYYYFAAFSITVPPLRIRKEDIEPFIKDYFKRHRARYQSQINFLDEDVMQLFYGYDWPGNLKELELLLDEITATITNETTITQNMLPLHFLFKTNHYMNHDHSLFVPSTKQDLVSLDQYLREAEQFYIQNVMQLFDGNVTKAAQAIQISRQNLQYRLRKLNKQK